MHPTAVSYWRSRHQNRTEDHASSSFYVWRRPYPDLSCPDPTRVQSVDPSPFVILNFPQTPQVLESNHPAPFPFPYPLSTPCQHSLLHRSPPSTCHDLILRPNPKK